MGIRVDGASDLISASDGTLTIEGQSVNTTGIVTASGGVKVGTAATIHSTGQFNIGVAATIFANGNSTFSGIVTASSFSGTVASSNLSGALPALDGSALTGIAGTEITNSDFAVGVSTFFVDYSTGRIGIGTDVISDSNVQLELVSRTGKSRLQFDNKPVVSSNDGQIGAILFRNAADSVGYISCKRESAADDAYIRVGTQPTGGAIAERLRITSAGKIGINTTATSSLVQLYGAQDGEGTAKGQLTIKDTAAYNATPQAGILFQIHHASNNAQAFVAGIRGLKANAADGDYDGCLAFDTRKHGQVAHEAARFTEDSNLKLPDDAKIELGGVQTGSGDLQIYHTAGDYSYIKDGSGRQYIQSNRVYMQNNAGDENLIYAEADDGVYLYFNGSTKIQTTNTGVSVTGSVTPSSGIYLGGAGGGNYLDDYEKGTWTPAINSGYTVSMHSNNQGHYIKVGKLVYYQAYVRVDTMSGSSGETYAMIKGLPFAHNGPGGIESNIVIGWTYGLVGDVYYGYIDDNTTQMVLLDHPSSGSRDHLGPAEVWQNGARLSVSGCYEVD